MINDFVTIRKLLLSDGVIAYPTETLWGLGGLASSKKVSQKINQIKQREKSKSFISITSDLKYCNQWLDEISIEDKKIIQEESKKQPISWLIPQCSNTPKHLVKEGYFALRLSYYSSIKTLCELIKQPLISSSANLSTHQPYDYDKIVEVFGSTLDYIINLEKNWQNPSQQASKIINIKTKEVIRDSVNCTL